MFEQIVGSVSHVREPAATGHKIVEKHVGGIFSKDVKKHHTLYNHQTAASPTPSENPSFTKYPGPSCESARGHHSAMAATDLNRRSRLAIPWLVKVPGSGHFMVYERIPI